MTNNTNDRIGIIGGGPAGLTSALYLHRAGHKNITILEKNSEVGGKALTVELKNSDDIVKNYELGAEYITYTYNHIFDLCELLNEPTSTAASIKIVNKTGRKPRFLDPAKIKPFFKIVGATIKYLWIGFRHRKAINQPNNLGIAQNPLLTMSLKEFEDKHNLTSLRAFFLNVGFGYNLDPDFPVIFVYRMLKPKLMIRIMCSYIPIIKHLFKRPIASIAENGTQGLYKKLAAYLNRVQGSQMVHTKHEVTRISRNDKAEGGITLSIKNGSDMKFDKLIFAIPPSFMLDLVDHNQLSPKEIDLFKKVKFHPYYVGMFGTLDKGGDPLPAYYYNNIFPDVKNGQPEPEPVQFTKRWDDTNLIARGYNWELAEVFDKDDPKRRDEIEAVFKTFMADRMETPDFEFTKPTECFPTVDKYWATYFPHVSIQALQQGYYDEFEKLQGKKNTYFAGSALTFEMMETTVAYSEYLINTYFSQQLRGTER